MLCIGDISLATDLHAYYVGTYQSLCSSVVVAYRMIEAFVGRVY